LFHIAKTFNFLSVPLSNFTELDFFQGGVVHRGLGVSTVWTVDFETPVCKLYLLLISANTAREKEKKRGIAAAHWCFKVCSQCGNYHHK
jgi:hypothetical protein